MPLIATIINNFPYGAYAGAAQAPDGRWVIRENLRLYRGLDPTVEGDFVEYGDLVSATGNNNDSGCPRYGVQWGGDRWFAGVARSTDGGVGATWETVADAWDYAFESACFRLREVSYQNHAIDRSTDGGTSWTQVLTLPFRASEPGSASWRMTESDGTLTLAFTHQPSESSIRLVAVYFSTDAGATWSASATLPTAADAEVRGMAAAGGSVYLLMTVAGIAGDPIFRTSDGGATWSNINPTGTISDGEDVITLRLCSAYGRAFTLVRDYVDGTAQLYQLSGSDFTAQFEAGSSNSLRLCVGFDTVLVGDGNNTFVFALPAAAATETLIAYGSVAATIDEFAYLTAALVSQGAAGESVTTRVVLKVTLVSNAAWADSVSAGVLLKALLVSAAQGYLDLSGLAHFQATLISQAAGAAVEVQPLPDEVWVLNAETSASTRYEGFDFSSFAKIDGRYYGCRSDGVYELDGDTDSDAPIQAMVSFGKQDFGTSALKRVSNIYVGTSSGGKLFVKVLVEGEEYLYQARDGAEELQVQRFDLGRGLRANYLEFELYNADGDDFELASVEFAAVPLSRRI